MTYSDIYLSPHLDDAILSCGGRIWQQVQASASVLILTVFAGTPAPGTPLSPFARSLHSRWGNLVDAAAQRREEDLEALGLLGAAGKHFHYLDCIYRHTPDGHFPYASEGALWGEIHPAEGGLLAELADQLSALVLSQGDIGGRVATLYAPLGVGLHVDHQIVRRAAELTGQTLIYYEDYPYAEDPAALQAVLAMDDVPWRAELTPLSEEALEAKVAAIARYRSQLSTFWTDLAEMSTAIRAFANQTGGGQLAERYWMSGT
jgi:LmbE family N-acetylglucosaminyl deacetylase